MKPATLATLRRVCFVIATAAWLGGGDCVPVAQAQTASSEWGAGYGAAAANNGVADENCDYWQTVAGKDIGAWWQLDLGQAVPVHGLKIAWARYEDKYHSPPARVIVQISAAKEGPWEDVLTIGADKLPRDESPYESERTWDYPLSKPSLARYVRLLFPDGEQAGAKYPGYICLGEVEIRAPGLASQQVNVEGPFGTVEVNVTRPALARLCLRGPNGLGDQSLLATHGLRPWASGGYTYVVGEDGQRYESRRGQPEKVEVSQKGGRNVLQVLGVKLASGGNGPPVATEDWSISAPGDGAQLVWKIVRRWQRDFTATYSGSPGLFFSFDARKRKNSTTSTFWCDPLWIAARKSALYALHNLPKGISENHVQTLRDRDTWAIFKLWSNWRAPCDLRLEVANGHLYRRGCFSWLSEAGAVTGPCETRRKGQVEEITLKIAPADKYATGYQLAVTLPDKDTERALRDFYGSVFNGGAINDQKSFDFGNETDGWYYAGSCWMYGATLAAGVPAAGPLSTRPYDAAQAFREHLAHVLCTLDEQGRTCFGYNSVQGGAWVDDTLHTIIGVRAYLLHSGDLAFVREYLPAMERMLDYFTKRRDERGLFKLAGAGAHWYYDWVKISGVNGYYNAFFFKAAADLAEMEEAAGRPEQARQFQSLAESVKTAFNKVLWKEDAPGGPRYIDWIDANGKEVTYFCDLCQWPAVAVGIASPEQARKIVATADARIAQLEKEHGYQGYATLTALWPLPDAVNASPAAMPFGVYMNGGSLLCQTYWEIVARARAGDAEGAARRLKLFAQRSAETGWAGNNSVDIHGNSGHQKFETGEPYLADMVAVTAATIHGVLGIQPTWEKLVVTPQLPAAWPRAKADVLYKGRRHRVTIKGGKVRVQPLEQVIALPQLWLMDFNLRKTAGGEAQTTSVDFLGCYSDRIQLASGATSGHYQSPIHDWAAPTNLQELTIAAELNGGQVAVVIETSDAGFQTIRSQTKFSVKDGVSKYVLQGLQGLAVRVRFDLLRQQAAGISPIVDGFRLVAGDVKNSK